MKKELRQRMDAAVGRVTEGDCNYLADILEIVAAEAGRWTNRWDDAVRIPDMIHDHARMFREMAPTVELEHVS